MAFVQEGQLRHGGRLQAACAIGSITQGREPYLFGVSCRRKGFASWSPTLLSARLRPQASVQSVSLSQAVSCEGFTERGSLVESLPDVAASNSCTSHGKSGWQNKTRQLHQSITPHPLVRFPLEGTPSSPKGKRNREREWNTQLSCCHDTEDVFELVDACGHQFKKVNKVTAFYTLARLSKGLRDDQKISLRNDARLHHVAQLAQAVIPACGWRSLANLAWADTHLRIGGAPFYTAIEEAALLLPLAQPPKEQELVALVSGFARCAVAAPRLFDHVAGLIHPCVTKYNAWQIAQLAWAYAKARHPRTDFALLSALKGGAVRQLGSFTPQGLSLVLWAWTEVGLEDAAFFDQIAAAVTARIQDYSPVDISLTARAFAKTGRDYSPLMAALVERSKAVVVDFAPQHLAALIWSMGVAKYYDEALLRRLLTVHVHALPHLTPLEASNLLWGLAMLRHYDPVFMDAAACSIGSRVAQFDDASLGSVLFAFATFGTVGPPTFLPTVTHEVLQRLRRGAPFKRSSLVNIAWGFMVLGEYPPELFARLRPALYRSDFFDHEFAKLHQVELALRLEAPTQHPDFAESNMHELLHDLWLSGYTKHLAKVYWSKMNQGAHVMTSALQRSVHASLERLGWACVEEYQDDEYVIDVALPEYQVAIEVDGPHHYAANAGTQPMGPTQLKHRLLRTIGWRLVVVPHFEWQTLSTNKDRDAYMQQRVQPLITAAREDATKFSESAEVLSVADQQSTPSPSEGPDDQEAGPQPSKLVQAEILARSQKLKLLATLRGKGSKIEMLKNAAVRRASFSKPESAEEEA